jgi:hypothetical protein
MVGSWRCGVAEHGNSRVPTTGSEVKIFDPLDPATGTRGAELLDPCVVERGGRWQLFLAGQAAGFGPPELFSASLPHGAPLASSGWTPTFDEAGVVAPLAGRTRSGVWDGAGGRHCPSHVIGRDPHTGRDVERIYYAGASENIWGPYAIGFLEWDGARWVDQPSPAFVASEPWERGSVFEPNVIYHDGIWKMWYVAGSNRDDHLVQGYAESEDGRTGWTPHRLFAPPEMRMFDFCVRQRGGSFDAIFTRVWVGKDAAPAETGLWWCRAERSSSRLADWSAPIQIMTAEDKGWHSGPFKPSFQFCDTSGRALIFFGGQYRTNDPGPFPFVFTLGCLEARLPLL